MGQTGDEREADRQQRLGREAVRNSVHLTETETDRQSWHWLVAEREGEEGEWKQSETWQINSCTYQDKHASIHVVNAHNPIQT